MLREVVIICLSEVRNGINVLLPMFYFFAESARVGCPVAQSIEKVRLQFPLHPSTEVDDGCDSLVVDDSSCNAGDQRELVNCIGLFL